MRHVSCLGEKRNGYRVLVGKPEERRPLRDSVINGKIILKCNLKRTGWEGFTWLRRRTSGELL